MGDERRAIRIRGVVQGVGFRPAMYRLADSHALAGLVRNDPDGVHLEVEGPRGAIDRFVRELRDAAPPTARIDEVAVADVPPTGERGFRIVASTGAATAGARRHAAIPADLAPCAACLRELADPDDRRPRYAFINCTACGPRYTIVRDVPYDRPATTMSTFAMCAACYAEYETPTDRRFHAEPNACPACGPIARLLAGGREIARGDAAVRAAASAIADGHVVAIKGAGGFVLAVDATSEEAVVRLRERKRRPHKPFAVMARSLADAERASRDSTMRRASCCCRRAGRSSSRRRAAPSSHPRSHRGSPTSACSCRRRRCSTCSWHAAPRCS